MGKWRYFVCFVMFLAVLFRPTFQVYASSESIGSVESFNHLNGEQKYLGEQYRDNYSLDMETASLSDGILEYLGNQIQVALNALANVLFKLELWLSYLTVTVFYMCFNLNLAELFGNQVNVIQQALNDSIFRPLFLIGCAAAFCVLIGRLLKRDMAGAIGQLAKIIFIVMISILVVVESDTMLTACNNITKEISLEILTGVNTANGYSQNVSDFAAESAGVLWRNLVHEPWLSMEFGSKSLIQDGEVEKILSLAPDSEERKELVEQNERGCFAFSRAGDRLAFTFFYLIPCVVKCVVYILIAFVQLVFQLLSIVYTFMAPLVLIISLFPSYEGILGSWFRKIIETQISILIISLIIGILIKFDEMIFDWAAQNQYGWMVALIVQIAISAALFMNRNKLLTALSHVQRGVSNPRYLRNRLRLAGNVYQAAPGVTRLGKAAKETIQKMNVPVKWTMNPFVIAQREKARKEDEKETEKKAVAKARSAARERRPDKEDVAGGSPVRLTAAGRNSIPRLAAAAVKETEAAVHTDRIEKGESLKELADEISRNIGHLAAIIESAEDTIREESIKEKNASDDMKRPTLMGEKKEPEGKGSKDNKEITVNVKGADGKEERKNLKGSEKMDVKGYDSSKENAAEKPRLSRKPIEDSKGIVTEEKKEGDEKSRASLRTRETIKQTPDQTKRVSEKSEKTKVRSSSKERKPVSMAQYMKENNNSASSR